MTDELPNGIRRQADAVIARLELQIAETLNAVREIKIWLMGDGTADNPGVMIRLDRLEQIEKNKEDDAKSTKNWRLGLVASLLVLFADRIWHYFMVIAAKAAR